MTTEQLEHDIRDALAWRADRTTVSIDPRIDVLPGASAGAGASTDAVTDGRRPWSWRVPVAAAVAVVVVAGGLTIGLIRDGTRPIGRLGASRRPRVRPSRQSSATPGGSV